MTLPRTLAERCVYSLLETASCQACVDACPRDAWLLDDDALGLDLEACDGCGLCRPACPEGAIDFNLPIALRTSGNQRIGMAACEYSGVEQAQGILPCLHALGLQEILRLYQRGVEQLIVAMGDCDDCPRGRVRRLEQRIASLNESLQQSGHSPFLLIQKTGLEWTAYQQPLEQAPAGPLVSRRGFLRAFVDADGPAVSSLSLFLGAEGELFDPLAQLLPDREDDAILPRVPVIEPQRCSGCDACIRVCPHQALYLEQDAVEPAYRLQASGCTGCGLCVDVCDQDAVSIQRWVVQRQRSIPLRQATCPSCGAPFHEPESVCQAPASRCRICSQTQHQRNLHQVLP